MFNQYLMTPDCVLKSGVEELNEWPKMIKITLGLYGWCRKDVNVDSDFPSIGQSLPKNTETGLPHCKDKI